MADGYALTWREQYCLSLSTGGRPDGTRDIYLHSVGEDTHGHLWWTIADGRLGPGGVRLKDRGKHVTDEKHFIQGATGPFARAHLRWNDEAQRVETELADIYQGSVTTAGRTLSRDESRRDPTYVPIPGSTGVNEITVEFSLTRPSSNTSHPSEGTFLPFSSGEAGIQIQVVSEST